MLLLQDLIQQKLAVKALGSQFISRRKDEAKSSDEPFGLAYDIENLPKIAMVHTLDRVQEKFEKKSTVIDIYPEGVFLPGVLISTKESNFSLAAQPASENARLPTTDGMSNVSPKRGLLSDAANNAKLRASAGITCDRQRIEKSRDEFERRRIGYSLCGAKKRKIPGQTNIRHAVKDGRDWESERNETGRLAIYESENKANHRRPGSLNRKRTLPNAREFGSSYKVAESGNSLGYRSCENDEASYEYDGATIWRDNPTVFTEHSPVGTKPLWQGITPPDAVVKLEYDSDSQSDSMTNTEDQFYDCILRKGELVYRKTHYRAETLDWC